MNLLHIIEKSIDLYFASVPRIKPSYKKPVRLIAHRGAHDRLIQENTDAAFERAWQLGCDGIEFDVHACADNTLIVNHDPTLRRLWGQDIAVNSVPFQELHTLVPNVPLLSDVIEKYGKRMHLFIELKAPFKALDTLVTTLKPLTPIEDYHLICLDERVLVELALLFPKPALLLVPVHNNVRRFCQLSLQNQYGGVLGHYLLFNNRQIKRLQSAHQIVGVGFVDSKFSLYRELNRSLDFLFTNNAEIITSCLKELMPNKG